MSARKVEDKISVELFEFFELENYIQSKLLDFLEAPTQPKLLQTLCLYGRLQLGVGEGLQQHPVKLVSKSTWIKTWQVSVNPAWKVRNKNSIRNIVRCLII